MIIRVFLGIGLISAGQMLLLLIALVENARQILKDLQARPRPLDEPVGAAAPPQEGPMRDFPSLRRFRST
jgi:hypothetical protein